MNKLGTPNFPLQYNCNGKTIKPAQMSDTETRLNKDERFVFEKNHSCSPFFSQKPLEPWVSHSPQVLALNKRTTIPNTHSLSAELRWRRPNVFFTFKKLRTRSTCPLLALHKSVLFSTFAVYSCNSLTVVSSFPKCFLPWSCA